MPGAKSSSARIALIRHARSSHVQTGWIDARGFRQWREAYEAAGIVDHERPAHLEPLAIRADAVVSSNAVRAVATARLLARDSEIVVSPLLREFDLEGPSLGGVRLPLGCWALAVGGQNLVRMLRGQYPSPGETARVHEAARWLDDLASERSQILAVTHGSIRRELAKRLVKMGWSAEPGDRSIKHWSAWVFSRRAE